MGCRRALFLAERSTTLLHPQFPLQAAKLGLLFGCLWRCILSGFGTEPRRLGTRRIALLAASGLSAYGPQSKLPLLPLRARFFRSGGTPD